MKSDGFYMFSSIYEAAQKLDPERRAAFYDAIFANRFDGADLDSEDPVVAFGLQLIAPLLEKQDQKAEAGRKAADKRWHTEPTEDPLPTDNQNNADEIGTEWPANRYPLGTHKVPKEEPEGTQYKQGIKDKGLRIKDKGISEESARTREDAPQEQTTVKRTVFRPPTAPDVWAYAEENGLDIDAEAFCDFYASKNWMVGRTKMTDWKAAARNWSRRDRERSAPQEAKKPASGTFGAFDQRKTPYETLFPSKYA